MARSSLLTAITTRAQAALGALRGRPGADVETRSAVPASWDLMRTGIGPGDLALPVSPWAAENHAAVSACVSTIAQAVSLCSLRVLRRGEGGSRIEAPDHPIARLFGPDGPNEWESGPELIGRLVAHALLRGAAYAEVIRDSAGRPIELRPYHPEWVGIVEIAGADGRRRYRFDVSPPEGGTRRVLWQDMLVLRDRTDDGVHPRSRLARAREALGLALAAQRYAASTFRSGAHLSGILTHPEQIGAEARKALRDDFAATYAGPDKAGSVAVLEEGLRWQAISNSPADAEMTAALRRSTEDVARIYDIPPAIIGGGETTTYAGLSEAVQMYYRQAVLPWVSRVETAISRALLTPAGRRMYEVELDVDEHMRGDLLTRMQSYRIAREIGLASANELRRWERLDPRTDPQADEYLSPLNMSPAQERRPIADRTPGGLDPETSP